MANWQQLLQMFQEQQSAANAANEQRYGDILGNLRGTQQRVGGTYKDIMRLLKKMGKSSRADIKSMTGRRKAQTEQDLISRGLGSTTIRSSMMGRHDEEKDRALQSLMESLAGQRAGALMGRAGAEERMGGLLASMMEARSDVGPDMGMLGNLMSMMGQGAGMGGGGYGGGGGGGGPSLGQQWKQQHMGGGGSGGSYQPMPMYSQQGGGGGYQGLQSQRAQAGAGLQHMPQMGTAFLGGFGPGNVVSNMGYQSPFAGMFQGMDPEAASAAAGQAMAGRPGRGGRLGSGGTLADRIWASIREGGTGW